MNESWTREPSNLSTLLIGDVDRSEFAGARAALELWGPVEVCPTAADAVAVLQRDQLAPDLIVAAQAFPDQISHAAIARLRRLAPLARVVGLLGSWCEGEMRTGSPWPGAVRVYGHQWASRAGRQLQRMASGKSCAWSLPPTATEEERLLADADPATTPTDSKKSGGLATTPTDSKKSGGLVLIHSRSPEMAEWLSTMCRSRGYATLWRREPASTYTDGVRAAIFDADRFGDASCAELRRLVESVRPSPVVALMTFPRAEDRRRAMQAGATAIVSKPFVLEDLFETERKILAQEAVGT
ncbi:MAG: hypothetical protein ABFC77_05125 [Thermoguttaceae bacterium]